MQIVVGQAVELNGQYHRTVKQAQGSLRRYLTDLFHNPEASAPSFFSESECCMSLDQCISYLGASFGERFAFHKYRFAPSYEEGQLIEDWTSWTMGMIQIWEHTKPAPVRWVAIYHDCRTCLQLQYRPYIMPHVHFILAGGYDGQTSSNVVFDESDVQLLIQTGLQLLPIQSMVPKEYDRQALADSTQVISSWVNTLRQHLHLQVTEHLTILLWNIVREIGPTAAWELVGEAQRLHKQGDQFTKKGQPRTLGGIYFLLVKQRVTPEQRQRLSL